MQKAWCRCGASFDSEESLERHHRHFPDHRPPTQPEEQPQAKAAKTRAVAHNVRTKELAHNVRTKELAETLRQKVATMRLIKVMHKTHIVLAIELAETALGDVAAMVEKALRGDAGSAAQDIKAHLAAVKDVLAGLHNVDNQCEQAARGALQPILRPLLASSAESKKRFAFLSLQELLVDTLQHNRANRQHILRASAAWKTGAFATPRRIATDIVHAKRFALSPLAKAAAAGEENDVRMGIKCWDDDFTATHPIGTKRGEHKYNVCTGSIINLPPDERDTMDNKLLIGIHAVKHAAKHGGVCRMLTGRDPITGKDYNEVTLCSELELLASGVQAEIPDDVNGGKMNVRLVVYFMFFEADALGSHQMGPWHESFQAQHPCRNCWWHSTCACAHASPFAPTEVLQRIVHAPECRRGALRTAEEHATIMARLRTTKWTSKAAKATDLKNAGVGKLYCVLDCIPGARVLDDCAADVGHIFLCGITRQEAFWMLDDLVPSCCSWDDLNAARKALSLPTSHSFPKLERPKTDSKSYSSVSMNMTGAETMHFAVNSIAMIDPLLDDAAKQRSSWVSWKAHVRLLTFALRYEFDVLTDGDTIDFLQKDYRAKFLAAYTRNYCKPKHEMLVHLKHYLTLYGPLRMCWTLHGEAFLQRLKRLFEATNYQTAPYTVVTMWAQRRALRGTSYSAADDDNIQWSSLLMTGPQLAQAAVSSQMLKNALGTPDHAGASAARYLSWLKRGPAELTINCWVLLRAGGAHGSSTQQLMVAKVREMSMITIKDELKLRLWVQPVATSSDGIRESADGMVRINKTVASKLSHAGILVRMEFGVSVTLLSYRDGGSYHEYRYVF